MNYSTSPAHFHSKHFDKSGTQQRRKSVIADGDFVNDLWASGYFAPLSAPPTHVVVRPPVSLPLTHPDVAKSKPKPWRDAGEELRGLFYHDAMKSLPNVRAFTLCLSDDVQRLARGQGKHCLAWLHKRVVRHLRATGDAPTPFWFAIEESDGKGELHAHGEIVACPEKEKAVRAALKTAGGKWERDGTQLRFSKDAPNFRWAGYAVKGAHKARPEWRRYMRRFGSPRRWVAGFSGKSVTASEGLKRAAIALHGMATRSH
jgi:hypothetical protein